jgi:hypothetical protein
MTSIYTLCDNILAAVSVDAAVVAYCTTNFTKQPCYFLGIDKNNPPEEALAPWVAIAPSQHGTDESQWNYAGSTIQCAVVVKDATVTNSASAPGVVTKYAGYTKAEGLASVVATAMLTYLASTAVDFRSLAFDCEYPFYRVTWSARVATDI